MGLIAFAAIAMQAEGRNGRYENRIRFDTDSGTIGVDNRCTGCISNNIDDFEGLLTDSGRSIKGFGGTTTTNVKIGTIVWRWQDDEGKEFEFRIPNSFYVPAGGCRLLSPQHWAKAQKDRTPIYGTGCETLEHQVTLFWNQRRNKLTVPLDKSSNVATIDMAPGYSKFTAFCAEAGIDEENQLEDPICEDTRMVSDDEGSESGTEDADSTSSEASVSDDDDGTSQGMAASEGGDEATRDPGRDEMPTTPTIRQDDEWCQPTGTNFNLNGPVEQGTQEPVLIEDEEDKQPTNLAAELLRQHHRFGHVSFRKLQVMAKLGVIPRKLRNCPVPVCSACLYAKAIRRKWRSKSTNNRDEAHKPTKAGQCVSVDQMVSPTPGIIAQMTGFLTTKRYKYATVYVDQASRLSFVYLQKTATGEETVEGKTAFEAYAKARGVTILAYHADNGIFKANKWVTACRASGQRLTFAGVDAHHQNGIAERRIRSLTELSRTMLIHANGRWPKVITTNLWPYALRMANDVINETPNLQQKEDKTPQQVFSGTDVHINVKYWKPFGCPVYVLNSPLRTSGGVHHKWKSRAKVGVYLGRSPQHARSVALVLDRNTALVSPQFHVNFDPSFHTVKQDEFDSVWQTKAGFVSREGKTDKAKKPNSEPANKTSQQQAGRTINWSTSPEGGSNSQQRKRQKRGLEPTQGSDRSQLQQQEENLPSGDQTVSPEPRPDVQTRSGRTSKPVDRLMYAMRAEVALKTANDVGGEIFCLSAMFPDENSTEESSRPLAYKAAADPDTMYLHEAMKEPDKKEFIKAMRKEWDDQFENGNWTIIHKSKVPKGAIVLPSVWQMKRKRDIKSRKIKKYKARMNVDGSRMRPGVDYDQTYSPVATWNSIRMLLTMTAVHNWHTTQLDFVLAFPQAPVDRQLFMKIPKGFDIDEGKNEDYVLRMERNVYGQKQAGRVWYKHLTKILTTKLKFEQSKIDECVFYRGQTMYVLYTDDSILAGPDKKEIDTIIKEMQEAKLDITVEGDLQDFLGVNIERKKDGTIHLTQPHLIDAILKDLRLENDNVALKNTPASSSKLLSRHSNSEQFDGSFNYRSVIGKLNYLEKGSRSDIAYITHQCARFTVDPKKEHGQALRWLGRYLKATRNKGTILRPVMGKDMEVYVDADFSGNWDSEETQDRDTARSRHGFIVTYAGCPILWKSQMQTEIALSSTESEYTGLSYALRDAIPIMELLKEMKARGFPVKSAKPRVHCRVFEDNSGALEIARTHKFRPRTKHLNVKLHFFRSYVDREEISITHIGTNDQPADFLTKPLNLELLTRHRKVVMGW